MQDKNTVIGLIALAAMIAILTAILWPAFNRSFAQEREVFPTITPTPLPEEVAGGEEKEKDEIPAGLRGPQ